MGSALLTSTTTSSEQLPSEVRQLVDRTASGHLVVVQAGWRNRTAATTSATNMRNIAAAPIHNSETRAMAVLTISGTTTNHSLEAA